MFDGSHGNYIRNVWKKVPAVGHCQLASRALVRTRSACRSVSPNPIPGSVNSSRYRYCAILERKYLAGRILEAIESSRILDQDHAARGGIRNPDCDQVQDVPVIGLQQRGEICVFAARTRYRIRMRPIGSPENTLGIGSDERFGEWRNVGIVRPGGRHAITCGGNLHVSSTHLDEVHQRSESGLFNTRCGGGSAEMIEDKRDG